MKKAITLIVLCVLVFMSLNNISYAGIDVFNASKGDINLNGELDTKDLRDILRAASGLHSFGNSSSYIYDMNSDGTVTPSDLRYALRVREGIDFHPDDVKEAERRIESISQHLSTEELDRLIKTVCKYGSRSIFFPESNEAAQKFIEKELKSYGYKVKKQPFTYAGCDTANIVTTLNAEEKHKEILVLSTHFDCWDGVHAAIDNASGVATLLHTAKILKESGIKFDKEIRIAFFSAEELGYHGAYNYLEHLTPKEKRNTSVYNIDMTGPSKLGGGRYIAVSTEPVSGSYVWREAQHNEISLAISKAHKIMKGAGEERFYSPVAAGRHDIVPFRESGIPSVTLSWRGIREEASYGSDYDLAPPSQIHTPLDTIDNFDFEAFHKTTELFLASLVLGFTAE